MGPEGDESGAAPPAAAAVRTAAALPTGTVTLLLADIEGSTRLWESRPGDMTDAIAALDRAIAASVADHRGFRPVEQGEGDSFVIAFPRASDAVRCALALQEATVGGPVRLRMSVHTGEVQLRDEANYVGPTINRAARIRDAGHGGQVLLSATAADLVDDELPAGASLLDLGRHRLRDLGRPEQVWQLCHPDLPGGFPPLRTADAVRNNLPAQLTTLVGRLQEAVELERLLGRGRMVTLTGAGGCGKTRLAVQVAADRLDAHPGGVWFVDLAAVNDPASVGPATAATLGLVLTVAGVSDALVRAIGDERVLLVFDNCEHLVAECAVLAAMLLRRCPNLTVMATSREPLGVEGEVTYRVPSLAVPGLDDGSGPDTLERFDAVALFAERARRARPGFTVDASNAAAVAEICRRLDGIPLAIELAAARLRVLSPARVRDGLNDRFRLLTGGSRTAVPRQQALQASVDWSYALLLEAERTVLNRLSVFAGGFTLDAAEVICAGGDLEAHHVFDLVTQLVDKSLVVPQEDEEGGRFTLLETVRAYGAARLVESGDAETTRARHYEFCLGAARQDPGDEVGYRRRVAVDYDNVRRALQWAEDQPDPAPLGRLTARLYLYWSTGTTMLEGSRWFAAVVERETHPARRAVALGRHALLLSLVGDQETAVTLAREAVALTRTLGDPRALAWALLYLAQAFPGRDEQVGAAEEALAVAGTAGDDMARAYALYQVGWNLHETDPIAAVAPLNDAVDLSRRHGYEWIVRLAAATLVLIRIRTGAVRDVLPEVEATCAALRAAGEGSLLGTMTAWLAMLRELTGDPDGADAALADLDAFAADVRALGAIARRDAGRSWIAMLRGDWEGAVEILRATVELPLEVSMRATFRVMLAIAGAYAGHPQEAVVHAEEAMRLSRVAAMVSPQGTPAYALAVAARGTGELDRAEDLAHAAVAEAHGHPMPVHARTGPLAVLASILTRTGRAEDGVRLFAAAAAEAGRSGIVPNAMTRADIDGQIDAARDRLGEERFAELWAEGAALPWPDAVAYARRGRGERRRPKAGWDALTPTERQVVALVADGASNGEIAERLFMAVPTVKSHLTHVYGKLGISTRGQLTAEAARRAAAAG